MSSRVLIVDDHERFRRTARRLLETAGWTVVGEAADGASALEAVTKTDADVVLLDVGLPDVSGLDVARELSGQRPRVAVIMISTHDSADYRDLAIANGARAFLPKAALSGPALESALGAGADREPRT